MLQNHRLPGNVKHSIAETTERSFLAVNHSTVSITSSQKIFLWARRSIVYRPNASLEPFLLFNLRNSCLPIKARPENHPAVIHHVVWLTFLHQVQTFWKVYLRQLTESTDNTVTTSCRSSNKFSGVYSTLLPASSFDLLRRAFYFKVELLSRTVCSE